MFYKYESDFDNDLMFWSNATADLWHKGESGESDLPDELLHALNELWTDSHLLDAMFSIYLGILRAVFVMPMWMKLEISSISLLFLSVCLFFFEFRRRRSEAHG